MSVGSKMKPRFRIWGEVVTVWPSTDRVKSWVEGRSDLGPMTMISDLLQLSLRKLAFIQDFIADRQFVMVNTVAGVMDLVLRYSCVSSA